MRTKTKNHDARVLVTPSVNPWANVPRRVVIVMSNVANPWRSG